MEKNMIKTTTFLSTTLLLAALASPVLAEDEPAIDSPTVEETTPDDTETVTNAEGEDVDPVEDTGTDAEPDYDPQIAETGVDPQPNERGGPVGAGGKGSVMMNKSDSNSGNGTGFVIRGKVFIKTNE
jgi:hypothetical protein